MLEYQLWDVFTSRALSGNPLAVVTDARALSDAQMQRVANEFNLSETSFVLPSERADARARYFTPVRELPMAGHPSIGTVYALHAAGRLTGPEVSLELGVGVVPMRLEGEGGQLERVWMDQGEPTCLRDCPDRAGVARALGVAPDDLLDELPLQVVSAGAPFMIVPVRSLEVLGRVQLDLALLPDVLPATHRAVLLVTLEAPESDVRCRMFGEARGVVEDPATGSAHGPLGWYLARHALLSAVGGSLRFVSHQGVEMGRPSELQVRASKTATGWSVSVGGQAVKVGEGTLFL